MPRQIFFYCNIEIDFLILSSIAKIIRNNYSGYKLVFIESNHPRIRGGKMKDYYHYFDRVISLKFFTISSLYSRVFSSMINILKFKNELERIKSNKKDIVFMFDIFKYNDLLVFDYFKKKKVDIVIISAFIGKRFLKKNLKVLFLPSLINYFYNLFSGAFYSYTESKIRNTNLKGYKRFNGKSSNVITLETSLSIINPRNKIFNNLEFPVPILFDDFENIKPANKLIFMVSSLHSSRYEKYWKTINNIIFNIPEKFEIYIKDHPQAISEARTQLKRKGLIFLEPKSNLEVEVFKNNISCICGVGSTGLITTSWMGLNVFDLTRIMNYPKEVENYLNEYIEMAPNVIKIKSLCQLKDIKIRSVKFRFNDQNWKHCLNQIFNDV